MTPEFVAKYLADRAKELSEFGKINILDGFTGVGGNLIQFAKTCGYCLVVDLDQTKLECT